MAEFAGDDFRLILTQIIAKSDVLVADRDLDFDRLLGADFWNIIAPLLLLVLSMESRLRLHFFIFLCLLVDFGRRVPDRLSLGLCLLLIFLPFAAFLLVHFLRDSPR